MSSSEPDGLQGSASPVVDGTAAELQLPQITGFRVIQELARSPRGIVYKARRMAEQDVVALKIFRDGYGNQAGLTEQLIQTAEGAFLLEHPNLVRCLGCFQDESRLILAMEFAPGEPLSRALQRNVRFQPARAIQIVAQCAEALRYASARNRFHGRLHPGDIVIEHNQARMIGVGLLEKPEHTPWSQRDPHLFSPLIYCAPEAMPSWTFPRDHSGRRAVDLYSLGAIFFHMLTGSPPFRGNDQGALRQERESLGMAVRWPRDTDRTLPTSAVSCVERLMSPQPQDRGDYETLLRMLRQVHDEINGIVPPPPPPPPVLPPPETQVVTQATSLEVPAAPYAQTGAYKGAPYREGAPGMQTYPSGYAQGYPSSYYDHNRSERLTSLLLVNAVVFIFAFLLGVAAKTFLLVADPQPPQPVVIAQPVEKPVSGSSAAVLQSTVSSGEEEAARQLSIVQEMLANGEVKYSTALLRVLNDILQKAGPSSRVGMRTLVLIGDVEEKMAQGIERPGSVPPNPKLPASGNREEEVFQSLVNRAQEQVKQQRFDAALAILSELPTPLQLAPFPAQAEKERTRIQEQAKAAFADLALAADKAINAQDYARARNLYLGVQARFGIEEWVEAAVRRIAQIDAEEEKFKAQQAAIKAEQVKADELEKLDEVLRSATELASTFNFVGAKTILGEIGKEAQTPEVRELARDYSQALHSVEWFFNKCRQTLKTEIQRHPKNASPIQVYGDAKGEQGFDIVDFDMQDITFSVSSGETAGFRKRAWNTINPLQPFAMLRLLMNKDDPQEHFALATFAYLLAWRTAAVAEENLRAADAETMSKGDKLKALSKRLSAFQEEELNAAVLASANVKEKQVALTRLLARVSESLTKPVPVQPQDMR